MSALSSSGARIRGDNFQHVYAAERAVEVMLPGSKILRLGVEDPDPSVGNADDVTIYRENEPSEFVQAKASVDARSPVNLEWLTKPSSRGGLSILSHLYEAWAKLRSEEGEVFLALVTNKPADPNDPVLILRDGIDGTVASRLEIVTTGSGAGRARNELAEHLQITEGELLTFLRHLSFRLGELEDDHRGRLAFRMAAVGLRSDAQALDLCIGMVRGWVVSGKRLLSADQVRAEIEALGIEASVPTATVVVQAIDHRPTEGASVSLDWVDRFHGEEARSRRVPIDREHWNSLFRPELLEAVRSVRSLGLSRVHVSGAMRLPTWFAVGNAFAETSGFEVQAVQGGELWTSAGAVGEFDLSVAVESTDNQGTEAAVVISIATDIRDDAREYVASLQTVGFVLYVQPAGGAGPSAISDAGAARDMAVAVRNEVRGFVRSHHPSKLHLFLACPGAFSMLLGHRWDRVADTQVYTDLAPGYADSYLIPN